MPIRRKLLSWGCVPLTLVASITFAPALALPADGSPIATAPANAEAKSAHDAARTGVEAPEDPGLDGLGSISLGHPHNGYLFNGVRMPKSKRWLLADPNTAWGTAESIAAVMHCVDRVFEAYPDSPPAIIGSFSKQGGGPFPPHKSHQSGRDADIYLWIKERGRQWYVNGNSKNLDRARTWAFMRAIITETDVEYILLDRSLQPLLEQYALKHETDRQWVKELFHGDGKYFRPLIKHVPGHTGHMHVRFYNRTAQERGRLSYDRIVAQGHIPLRHLGVTHRVKKNDTLSEIAQEYGALVERIRELNSLQNDLIKVGQVLKIQKPIDLRAARDKVVIPPRHLPRTPPAAPTRTAAGSKTAARATRSPGRPRSAK